GMVLPVVAVVVDGAADGLAAVALDVLGPIDDVIDEVLGVIDDILDEPGDAVAPPLCGHSPLLAPLSDRVVPLPIEHYTPRRGRRGHPGRFAPTGNSGTPSGDRAALLARPPGGAPGVAGGRALRSGAVPGGGVPRSSRSARGQRPQASTTAGPSRRARRRMSIDTSTRDSASVGAWWSRMVPVAWRWLRPR